jgi:hypothetical protein
MSLITGISRPWLFATTVVRARQRQHATMLQVEIQLAKPASLSTPQGGK